MLSGCWNVSVVVDVTCCQPGETKPPLNRSHAVRLMGQVVSHFNGGPAETSSLPVRRVAGFFLSLSLALWLSSEEPAPVTVQGSAFCNSYQYTLYLLYQEPGGSKFSRRDTGTNLTLFQWLLFMFPLSQSHSFSLYGFCGNTTAHLIQSLNRKFGIYQHLANSWSI